MQRPSAPVRALVIVVATGCAGTPDAPAPDDRDEPGATAADLGLRPLTRSELDHAVQDLLGIEWYPSGDMPPGLQDGYATDVNAGAIDGLLVETMLQAAERTAQALGEAPPLHAVRVEGEDMASDWDLTLQVEGAAQATWVGTFEDRAVRFTVDLPVSGVWEVAFHVGFFVDDFLDRDDQGDPLVDHAAIDGVDLRPMVLREQGTLVPPFVHRVELEAGRHEVALALEVSRGQTPVLDAVEFRPADAPPAALRDLVACGRFGGRPRVDCLMEALAPLARRAWRRPLDPARARALRGVVEAEGVLTGDPTLQALAGVEAILASPDFWFVVEGGRGRDEGGVYLLSPHELATRLALFLWASLPDEALLDCADQGGLGADDDGPCGLDAQVDRLLDDPRAHRVVDGFAMSWLGLGRLDALEPDPATFPELDDALIASLREEVRLILDEVLLGDAPLEDVLSSDFTFVDARLAAHYELPAVDAARFQRVQTDPAIRGGVLRTGGVLLATAHPARRSDVRRGAMLLSALGCDPPDPPPADVPAFDDQRGIEGLLEQTAHPPCSGCHDTLNPWGLSLSSYDVAGRYRPDQRVDLSGWDYPLHFEAFDDLVDHLRADDLAVRCFVRHLTSWAVGRSLEVLRAEELDPVETRTLAGGTTFRAAVHAVTRSPAFATRPLEAR